MALEIKRECVVIIDGAELGAFFNSCEVVRVALNEHRDDLFAFGGMGKGERMAVEGFINEIFDKCM